MSEKLVPERADRGCARRFRQALLMASIAVLWTGVVTGQSVQSQGKPAGTVLEPGSQLLFLLDTGIRPAEMDAGFNPALTIFENFGLSASINSNLVSVTNTNPQRGVTVQLAYYNAVLEKVLDFLVVLTCNDTMTIDPFDYTIPGTALNTSNILFQTSGVPPAISTQRFGNGVFLLAVTAVGAAGNDSGMGSDTSPVGDRGDFDDPEDLDSFADWLFPFELTPASLATDCSMSTASSIGLVAGVNDSNLTALNASAISHNYLTGSHTLGMTVGGQARAFRISAWVRPAVNASVDLDPEDTSESPDQTPDMSYVSGGFDVVGPNPMGNPLTSKLPDSVSDDFDIYTILDSDLDGDGLPAPDGALLAGSEEIWLTLLRNAALVLPANYFYLRSEALGGAILETNCEGPPTPAGPSLRCDASNPWSNTPVDGNGLFAWTFLFPEMISAGNQRLLLLSAKDDYNGSNNTFVGGTHPQAGFFAGTQSTYCLNPATSYFTLQIFNNNEEQFATTYDIAVRGLEVFRTESMAIPGGVLVDGGSSPDLTLTTEIVELSLQSILDLTPGGELGNFLGMPVAVNDERGSGWISLVHTLTRDFSYALDGSLTAVRVAYDGERGSYVILGRNTVVDPNLFFSFFLASKKLPPPI